MVFFYRVLSVGVLSTRFVTIRGTMSSRETLINSTSEGCPIAFREVALPAEMSVQWYDISR